MRPSDVLRLGTWWASLATALALSACTKPPAPGPTAPPGRGAPGGGAGRLAFPVEVATVEEQQVEYSLTAVGSVEPFEVVQVTARVTGGVDAVRFTEGQTVKAGDALVEVDSGRYALAVRAARAALDKAEAARVEADAALKRREAAQAGSPGLIPAEELATFRTRQATAQAEAAAAQVALERAQLDLRDAYVRAPVGGVLQTRTVQTGQYVQPGAVLATLVRREPMLVRFKVPEVDAPRVEPGLVVRFAAAGDERSLEAAVTHIAQVADPASRMVTVTAQVRPHDQARARPGAFAQVTVPVSGSRKAPVVPQTAVRPSEKGFLAYVVEGEVARERVLALGLRTPQGLIEVRSGVTAGEQLVVRGAEALKEGSKVVKSGTSAPHAGELVDGGGGS